MTGSCTLVLASASPRRLTILRTAGYEVAVRPVDAIEIQPGGGAPLASVVENAVRKAAAAWRSDSSREVVVAADTVLILHDGWVGKPADLAAAEEMLASLVGRSHDVATAVCVRSVERTVSFVETTRVSVRPLSRTEIAAYHAAVTPLDKAGAYNIDEPGPIAGGVVESIEGSYTNVMGLPIERLEADLRAFGVRPTRPRR